MKSFSFSNRSWNSDSIPGGNVGNARYSYDADSAYSGRSEELVEITLDVHDDETIVLRSVEPVPHGVNINESSAMVSAAGSSSASRSSSNRFKQFSHELKAEAVLKAKQFKAEFKRFTCRHGHASCVLSCIQNSGGGGCLDSAMADRALRRQLTQVDRSGSSTRKALKGLKFISNCNKDSVDAWNEVQIKFDKLNRDGFLYRADFAQCIAMKESKEFALELFDALSRRRRLEVDKITKEELYEFWSQITDQSFDSRLQIFFDMVDKNEDGRITEEEVKEVIMLSASDNKLSRLKEQAEEYAALIMEELDPEGLGYIELWQLETLLLQKDTYLNFSQALSQTSQSLSENLHGLRKRNPLQRRRIWVLTLWFLIMAGLFTWKFLQYKQKDGFKVMGYCLSTAKGSAETLKFNMALVLLPVCRNTITWLRSTKLGHFVPFDDNINFHKTITAAIVVGVILHTGNHITCDFPRIISASDQDYKLYLMDDFGPQKPNYIDLIQGAEAVTGIVMVMLMVVAFTLATKWFRRSLIKLPKPFNRLTGFNAFMYSHYLFVIVYILLVNHGLFLYLVHIWYLKTTWMYLAVPVLLYAGERTLRFFRSGFYTVHLSKVAIYTGNVLTLQMSKPLQFRYKSGQYMFVQCPAISQFEWHPFSITSAPDDDYLSVHIRQLGDWTQELHRIFSQACEPPVSGRSGLLTANEATMRRWTIWSSISILKDLLNNIIKMEEHADLMSEYSSRNSDLRVGAASDSSIINHVSLRRRKLKTTSAYFYWVTREQGSFDWFKSVMDEVAEQDQRCVIEMHNYLTSVYEEGDARSALITMVQALNHAKNGFDVVSGTRVRTHFARPNWTKVLSKLSSKHTNARIGVFYCGAPGLAKELSKLCYDFNQKGSTKFEFHKEHF